MKAGKKLKWGEGCGPREIGTNEEDNFFFFGKRRINLYGLCLSCRKDNVIGEVKMGTVIR